MRIERICSDPSVWMLARCFGRLPLDRHKSASTTHPPVETASERDRSTSVFNLESSLRAATDIVRSRYSIGEVYTNDRDHASFDRSCTDPSMSSSRLETNQIVPSQKGCQSSRHSWEICEQRGQKWQCVTDRDELQQPVLVRLRPTDSRVYSVMVDREDVAILPVYRPVNRCG